jgi:putative aldouronate transport system substrate-binding protein
VLVIIGTAVFFVSHRKPEVVINDGKIHISIVNKDFSPSDPANKKFVAKMESDLKKQGIDVVIDTVEIPSGGYAEKLTLMLMSGKAPDIIYFQSGGDRIMAEQGLLADLRPYAAQSKLFNERMLDYNKKRLANFPYLIRVYPLMTKVPLIRADWLDKLGMQPPTTLDDYYKLMKAVSRTDLNGDGKKGIWGISATENTDRLDEIFNKAFGVTSTWMKDKNGAFVYSKTTEFEKNKLAFYRKLYAEKILDNEYITTKWNVFEDKFFSGKVGIVTATNGKVVDIYETKMAKVNGAAAKLVVLEPPTGVSKGFMPVDVNKEDRGFAISALSKHPDIAFKVLEYLISDDGQFLDRIGIEGKQYKMQGAQIVLMPEAKDYFERFFLYPKWQSPVKILSDNAFYSMKLAENYYSEDVNFIMPRQFAATYDALNNLYKEYSCKIISGEYPLEKFDEFVKQWSAEGGDKLTTYANQNLK